ncbi:hypothetical protein KBC55_01050 [Patescibacteria group bacterium]|nr:hypothetical protein [Patescibacteria group bacterium]
MIKTTSFAKELVATPVRRVSLGVSLVLLVISGAVPAWRILPIVQGREAVPLHYNVHIGVDWIGPWWFIFTPVVTGALFMIINIIAIRLVWRKEPQLASLIAVQTMVVQLLLLIASIFVVLLNVSYG